MRLPLGLSYRRMLLDAELGRLTPGFSGLVVDIGAKQVPRGSWTPPLRRVRRWIRLNLAQAERPDVIADAAALPIRSASVNWVVCIEVLQYVSSPDTAMREIARTLAPGGSAVIAVPFLHRADGPTDRHRFTQLRARELCEGAGLRVLAVAPQGCFFATVANQLRQAAAHLKSRPVRWLVGAVVVPLGALLMSLDGLGTVRRSQFLSSYSTGFVALTQKA